MSYKIDLESHNLIEIIYKVEGAKKIIVGARGHKAGEPFVKRALKNGHFKDGGKWISPDEIDEYFNYDAAKEVKSSEQKPKQTSDPKAEPEPEATTQAPEATEPEPEPEAAGPEDAPEPEETKSEESGGSNDSDQKQTRRRTRRKK
jgi:hypothetical protein